MISGIIPSAGEVATTVVVVFVIVAAAIVVGVLWVRRRIRRVRRRISTGVVQWAQHASTEVFGDRPVPDRHWMAVYRSRRRLARARAGAGRAVESARSGGAPLGDLESLLRRLNASAEELDASLAIAQRSSRSELDYTAVVDQADALVESARQIEKAAGVSLAATSAPAVTRIARDVHHEAEAVRAGAKVGAAALPDSVALASGHSDLPH